MTGITSLRWEPKGKKERKPKKISWSVTFDEMVEVLKNLEQMHHKLAVIMAYGGGCRLSEVLALEPRDFNFTSGELFIRQGKNSKDRITVLPPCIGDEHMKYFPIPCSLAPANGVFQHFVQDIHHEGEKRCLSGWW